MLSAIQVSKIAEVVNAKIVANSDKLDQSFIKGVVLDSRQVKTGDLFVALKGEKTDGHSFVQNLSAETFALVSMPQKTQAVQIVVADVRLALLQLADFARSVFVKPIIGITGNSGKTSVKELTKSILSEKFKLGATVGNLNNDLGMPISLLNFAKNTEIGILELGANHLGEIASLTKIARPNIAIITNVTGAHLGEFGSFDNIAKAKSEILENLTIDDLCILPLDDKYFSFWQETNKHAKLLSFSLKNPQANLYASEIKTSLSAIDFCVNVNSKLLNLQEKSPQLQIPALGEHQVLNALPAIATGLYFGLNWQQIKTGLSKFKASKGRMQIVSGLNKSLLIDDTYNANQGSVEAGIKFLCSQKEKTKILVLGDIKELGAFSEKIHTQLGEFAKQAGVDFLYTYGELAVFASRAFGANSLAFSSKAELGQNLKQKLDANSLVLIKASRSMQLEDILDFIKA